MAAVALATAVAIVGTVRAQTLGACRFIGCRTGTEVARLPLASVSLPDMSLQFSSCLSSAFASFVIGDLHDGIAAAMQARVTVDGTTTASRTPTSGSPSRTSSP